MEELWPSQTTITLRPAYAAKEGNANRNQVQKYKRAGRVVFGRHLRLLVDTDRLRRAAYGTAVRTSFPRTL